MRILVIDDDQAVCEVFGEFLHEIGHEPVITHTAETALDTLREERPDAVLLDVCLPGMSGLDFMKLEAVRDLAVPILVISGRATESQAQEAMRAGAFDFIGKPVALRRLQEVLACFEAPAAAPTKVKDAEVPPELFTPMFTCARVAGWSAHILEQKREGRLIRPTAKYIGPPPRPVSAVPRHVGELD